MFVPIIVFLYLIPFLKIPIRKKSSKFYQLVGSRFSEMESALNPYFFNVCGFQEIRNAKGHKVGQNFVAISSGCICENGTKKYGCDIWFSTVTPIVFKDSVGNCKDFFVTFDNLHIVFAHPRYLCVSLDVEGLCLYFISLHFPHRSSGQEGCFKFLEELFDTSAKFHVNFSRLFWLCDLNLTFGSSVSSAVGMFSSETV